MAELYTIMAQAQTVDVGADGSVTDVVEVTFRTARGATGKVKIPRERFTAELAATEVEPIARELEAAFEL